MSLAEKWESMLNDEAQLQKMVTYAFADADTNGSDTVSKEELSKHFKECFNDLELDAPSEDLIVSIYKTIILLSLQ